VNTNKIPFALVSDPKGQGLFKGFWRDPETGHDYHDTTDLFHLDSDSAVEDAVKVATVRGELSILVVDAERRAWLVYLSALWARPTVNFRLTDLFAAGEPIGWFRRSDESPETFTGSGYTYDPRSGQLWIVDPNGRDGLPLVH
jgi:hypothetical protein